MPANRVTKLKITLTNKHVCYCAVLELDIAEQAIRTYNSHRELQDLFPAELVSAIEME